MRILLDENIPTQLRAFITGRIVKSVNDSDIGWKNIKNGRLLTAMDGRFELLITADRNIYSQQNLVGRKICILVLPTNRRNDVIAMRDQIMNAIEDISIGEYVVLEKSGKRQIIYFSRGNDTSDAS